ncbi:MAG: RagB/SusD family nutrient uptake outer membrane protein [Rikenellaceae bacterium]|nr:RagB/SusD family nutrient uptake outer membrane protein [Rikenellaceae bacterium]
MKKNITIISALAILMSSCSLYEPMRVQADKDIIFGSEYGVEAYALSLYRNLPTLYNIPFVESGVVDYAGCRTHSNYYLENAYNAEIPTSWSWGNLRKVSYFLDALNSESCKISDEAKAHYEGFGRFFRAWFYYDKLTAYGGVPWFDHCISSTDRDEMYKDRDNRDVIIEHIIEDLDFAYQNIKTKSSVGNTLISRYAALALKSRACLFEASYRKYQDLSKEQPPIPEDSKYTPEYLYAECVDAAGRLMDSGVYKLNTADGEKGAYRTLFYSSDCPTNETILGVSASDSEKCYGEANWKFFSGSYGNGYCGSRVFINTYLNTDGTPFTSTAGYSTKNFVQEFSGRDARLAQTFIGPAYKMKSTRVAPDIVNNVAPTGYHIIKFVIDDPWYNNRARNINGYPLIRYAEVLLNYAEAKAELGTLTNSDWSNTIGALRLRAGISGGTTSKPSALDPYMVQNFYPDVTDPVIMEIRRERAIELFYEGFRRDDLNRWACGKLFESLKWTGIHIDAMDTPIDLNGDGVNDCYFSFAETSQAPALYKSIFVHVYADESTEQGLRARVNPDGGYDLEYVLSNKRKFYDDGRQYLQPIPSIIIKDYAARGYTLTQNHGW